MGIVVKFCTHALLQYRIKLDNRYDAGTQSFHKPFVTDDIVAAAALDRVAAATTVDDLRHSLDIGSVCLNLGSA